MYAGFKSKLGRRKHVGRRRRGSGAFSAGYLIGIALVVLVIVLLILLIID
jgi:succinate dehydrogenase hydrophobic anchor subunit